VASLTSHISACSAVHRGPWPTRPRRIASARRCSSFPSPNRASMLRNRQRQRVCLAGQKRNHWKCGRRCAWPRENRPPWMRPRTGLRSVERRAGRDGHVPHSLPAEHRIPLGRPMQLTTKRQWRAKFAWFSPLVGRAGQMPEGLWISLTGPECPDSLVGNGDSNQITFRHSPLRSSSSTREVDDPLNKPLPFARPPPASGRLSLATDSVP
jgi:hypothetical protein